MRELQDPAPEAHSWAECCQRAGGPKSLQGCRRTAPSAIVCKDTLERLHDGASPSKLVRVVLTADGLHDCMLGATARFCDTKNGLPILLPRLTESGGHDPGLYTN